MKTKYEYSAKDVMDYFFKCCRTTVIGRQEELLKRGLLINTKTRSDILTGESQGKISLCGHIRDIDFVNLKGGVWRARIIIGG